MAFNGEMMRISIHGDHLNSTMKNVAEKRRMKVVVNNFALASAIFVMVGGQCVTEMLSYPFNIHKKGFSEATKTLISYFRFTARHMNYVAFLLLVTPIVFFNPYKYLANQIAMFLNIALGKSADKFNGKIPFKERLFTVDELEQYFKDKAKENKERREREAANAG